MDGYQHAFGNQKRNLAIWAQKRAGSGGVCLDFLGWRKGGSSLVLALRPLEFGEGVGLSPGLEERRSRLPLVRPKLTI